MAPWERFTEKENKKLKIKQREYSSPVYGCFPCFNTTSGNRGSNASMKPDGRKRVEIQEQNGHLLATTR